MATFVDLCRVMQYLLWPDAKEVKPEPRSGQIPLRDNAKLTHVPEHIRCYDACVEHHRESQAALHDLACMFYVRRCNTCIQQATIAHPISTLTRS